jgi:hypothetical protein
LDTALKNGFARGLLHERDALSMRVAGIVTSPTRLEPKLDEFVALIHTLRGAEQRGPYR